MSSIFFDFVKEFSFSKTYVKRANGGIYVKVAGDQKKSLRRSAGISIIYYVRSN